MERAIIAIKILRPTRLRGKGTWLYLTKPGSFSALAREEPFITSGLNAKEPQAIQLANLSAPIIMRVFPQQKVELRCNFRLSLPFDVKGIATAPLTFVWREQHKSGHRQITYYLLNRVGDETFT